MSRHPGLLSSIVHVPDDESTAGTAQHVVVCQGYPRCELEGDEAIAAAVAGCIWCKRITVHADGTQTVTEPGEA